MTLLLGLMAAFVLWWFARDALRHRKLGRLVPALTQRVAKRVLGYGGLALALLLLLRGRIDMAIPLAAAGVWCLEGAEGLSRRVLGLFRRRSVADETVIRFEVLPDGRTSDGIVLAGPETGRRLSELAPDALAGLLILCRRTDRIGARRLEAYLNRREAGGRVDAEGDADPRTRRPPDPGAMTQEEANQILGLQRGASPEEIRTAHRSLMKRAHPDQGGSAEHAARVNAARDRLLSRHR